MRRAVAGERRPTRRPRRWPRRSRRGGEPDACSLSLPTSATSRWQPPSRTILTISANGFGKRTSSFEYRITNRGGKGIVAMAVNARNGKLVASFPVEDGDGLMLVTNGGQLIRVPVDGIRVAGRGTQGVTVFNTGADEEVVSVERIPAEEDVPDTGPEADEVPEAE